MAVAAADKVVRGADLQQVGSQIRTALAGKVSSSSVSTIVSLTQAQYNALTTKDANTAYIITDAQSGGTTEVFWATYGTTTFAEVDAAYQAGKVVFCDYNGSTYYVSVHDDGTFYDFFCVDNSGVLNYLYLDDQDAWSNGSLSLAPLASPSFSGTPTAPTPTSGDNTTKIATTAFVNGAISVARNVAIIDYGDEFQDIEDAVADGKAVFCNYNNAFYPLNVLASTYAEFTAINGTTVSKIECIQSSPNDTWQETHFTLERISHKTSTLMGSSTSYPSDKCVYDALALKAPLASPALTGTPTAPTAAAGTNTTQIATTAFVQGEISGKENTSNKVTSLSASSTDTQYPSAKATYDTIHPEVVTSQPAGGMAPNIVYELGTLSGNTTFTLASPADADIANHYFWTFTTPSTAPTITWPAGITSWYGGSAPTISASKHYEVSVLDGVGICMEV